MNGLRILKRDDDTNVITYVNGNSKTSIPIVLNNDKVQLTKISQVRTDYINAFYITNDEAKIPDLSITYNSKVYEFGCRVCILFNEQYYDCLNLLSIPNEATNVLTTYRTIENDPALKNPYPAITDREWPASSIKTMDWYDLDKTDFEIDRLFWYKSTSFLELPNLPPNVQTTSITTKQVCAHKMLMTSSKFAATVNTQMPVVIQISEVYSEPTSILTYIYGNSSTHNKFGNDKMANNFGCCPILTPIVANPYDSSTLYYTLQEMIDDILGSSSSYGVKVIRADASTVGSPFFSDEIFMTLIASQDVNLGYGGTDPFYLTYGGADVVISEWLLLKDGDKVYFIGKTTDDQTCMTATWDGTLEPELGAGILQYQTHSMKNWDGNNYGRDIDYISNINTLIRDIANVSPQRLTPDKDWIISSVASGINFICICSNRIPSFKHIATKISAVQNENLKQIMPLETNKYRGTQSLLYLVDLTSFLNATPKDIEKFFANIQFYWWCQWIGSPQIISKNVIY
jgi:hypothetical protein